MKKKMNELRLNGIKDVHNFLRKNRDDIFEQERKDEEFISLFLQLGTQSAEEIKSNMQPSYLNRIQQYGTDEYTPVVEYLVTIADDSLDNNDELAPVLRSEKYLWECDVKKVASALNEAGVRLNDIIIRIQNEYIYSASLGTVMARSNVDAKQEDYKQATDAFALKIQEHKRDQFIKELRDLLK